MTTVFLGGERERIFACGGVYVPRLSQSIFSRGSRLWDHDISSVGKLRLIYATAIIN